MNNITKLTLVLGLICATGAVASDQEASHDKAAATPATSAGLRVYLDPVTGRLRSPDEAEAAGMSRMSALAKRFPTQPAQFHADGSVSQYLGAAGLMHTVVRLDSEGNLQTLCTDNEKTAAAFVAVANDDSDTAVTANVAESDQ